MTARSPRASAAPSSSRMAVLLPVPVAPISLKCLTSSSGVTGNPASVTRPRSRRRARESACEAPGPRREAFTDRCTSMTSAPRWCARTGAGRTTRRAALARGVEPHLADDALMAIEAALNDHVDEKVQQALDVAAREAPSAATLLDEQHQLLERELCAGRVHAGDGSRMTRVDVAQVIERLLGPQLGEQDAVRPHSQAALAQLLRRDARETLVVL